MNYDKRVLIIMSICVAIGFICLVFGIITSEIEIRKNQIEVFYGTFNN